MKKKLFSILMKKKLFSILCAGLMLTACGQQNKNETTMDFTDDVQVALADSGHIDLSSLQWTREPEGFEVKGDTILITTAPKTDLWQRTYYHFQNDNAPVLQMKTREKFFSFVVKTDFTGSHHRFDQCGIVMYLGSENWLKGSVERFCGIRERGVPASGQRSDEQWLLRLGHDGYSRKRENHVVPVLSPRG